MAISRVKKRVEEGGHHIETEVIRRRYSRGLQNLFSIYLPLATEYLIYDNSKGKPELVVARLIDREIQITNSPLWEKLKEIAHKKN